MSVLRAGVACLMVWAVSSLEARAQGPGPAAIPGGWAAEFESLSLGPAIPAPGMVPGWGYGTSYGYTGPVGYGGYQGVGLNPGMGFGYGSGSSWEAGPGVGAGVVNGLGPISQAVRSPTRRRGR